MGKLLNQNGKTLFPEDMKLISHWGLRDELKSDYADSSEWVGKAAHDLSRDAAQIDPNHSPTGDQQRNIYWIPKQTKCMKTIEK
jgi:hypothetical protein